MSKKDLHNSTDEDKDFLTHYPPRGPVQKQFASIAWEKLAMCTWVPKTSHRKTVWDNMSKVVSPIPASGGFLKGITHHNDSANVRGQLWHPVRAIASSKVHHYPKLCDDWHPVLEEYLPNLHPASCGIWPHSTDTWNDLTAQFPAIKSPQDYIKHILALHDGEARHVRQPTWKAIELDPASGGISNPVFWRYQFARKRQTRTWLYNRELGDQKDTPLTYRDIDWILREEEGETHLIRLYGEPPASGGNGEWQIICGNCITLVELFWFFRSTASAFDLYRLYTACQVWITKRFHSFSQSEKAIETRNAKQWKHEETGLWGLNRKQK